MKHSPYVSGTEGYRKEDADRERTIVSIVADIRIAKGELEQPTTNRRAYFEGLRNMLTVRTVPSISMFVKLNA